MEEEQEEGATVEMLKEIASPVRKPTGKILEGKAEEAISIEKWTDKEKFQIAENWLNQSLRKRWLCYVISTPFRPLI